MNICVVSTFEGDVEEYMSMIAEFDEQIRSAVSDFDIGVVKTDKTGISKVIAMINVVHEELFDEIRKCEVM